MAQTSPTLASDSGSGQAIEQKSLKVLVTGGSGFIGSHVVDKLSEAGHTPVIFDRLAPRWHDDTVASVIGELDDVDALEAAMQGCDAVMHLAAAADVNEVVKAPLDSEACNARGTVTVLEAARRAEVDRVIYASTIWVYTGESGQRVDEDSALGVPNHLYTASKLAGEMYCRSYGELYGLDHTILRFGIPYGPRAREAAVIPAFVNKALAGDPLTVAGGGAQSRRFVYVEDLADGCVAALDPVAVNRIYNLVSDESTTILEIAEIVQDLVADVPIESTGARTADYVGVEVSGARAEAELSWTATTTFREGVRRYVEWRAVTDARAVESAPQPSKQLSKVLSAAATKLLPALLTALPFAFGIASAALLFTYLDGVHAIGLSNAEARTVGLTTAVAIILYLVSEIVLGRRRERRYIVGALAFVLIAFAAFAVMLPWSQDLLNLADPTSAVIVLSVTGAALGMALAATGVALARSRTSARRSPAAVKAGKRS
ncbi:MAG: NAD-dependent epimerase/dehydratase family protein [Solirubrobacterales bacterium]|nr:NAD-dependent epimerase/dehydratase family protein [Solirubrobacterales bacterium]